MLQALAFRQRIWPIAVQKSDLSARTSFLLGVSTDIRMDRKIRFTGRLRKRDPNQISCAIQIKHSALIARTAKSNIAMVAPWSNTFISIPPGSTRKSAQLGRDGGFSADLPSRSDAGCDAT
jgi:hypothetical protein